MAILKVGRKQGCWLQNGNLTIQNRRLYIRLIPPLYIRIFCFSDITFIDFCIQCKKCADVCPSKAISFEDVQEVDGVKRWQINQELCFNYWSIIGTDCGRCVAVCPYSHPDNALHNFVRAGIRQSALFRKAALKLDDFIYGRKPKQHKKPDWVKLKQ